MRTTEDRRKAAAVTNEIRREKRALFEQVRLNREIEEMIARDEARRAATAREAAELAGGCGPRSSGALLDPRDLLTLSTTVGLRSRSRPASGDVG